MAEEEGPEPESGPDGTTVTALGVVVAAVDGERA